MTIFDLGIDTNDNNKTSCDSCLMRLQMTTSLLFFCSRQKVRFHDLPWIGTLQFFSLHLVLIVGGCPRLVFFMLSVTPLGLYCAESAETKKESKEGGFIFFIVSLRLLCVLVALPLHTLLEN